MGAELDADGHLASVPALQGPTDEQLVVAHAVEVAGVEQGDAGVERGVDGGDALRLVGRTVDAGHPHAAEAEGGDVRPAGAELPSAHGELPFVG
jgi:hypothetical protein